MTLTDYRYKLTQQDILDIRELRSLGIGVNELAEHYSISTSTVYYWTSNKIHKNAKIKNAKRRYKPKDQNRIKRDMAKRKQNFEETPKTQLLHQYHSRIKDKRRPHIKVHSVQGILVDTIKQLNKDGDLQRGNSKINI